LIAKLIEKLMLSYKTKVYGFISGLLITSPIAIIVNMQREYPNELSEESITTWFLGFVFVLLGTLLSYFLGKKEASPEIEELSQHV
jgi:uncharacterized membrane protein